MQQLTLRLKPDTIDGLREIAVSQSIYHRRGRGAGRKVGNISVLLNRLVGNWKKAQVDKQN